MYIPGEQRPLGRTMCRWKDNIKMNLTRNKFALLATGTCDEICPERLSCYQLAESNLLQ
jgi:hypothetical protein